MMDAIRSAFRRMKGRVFFSQWVGNFVLMLLAAGWLQIPDSHAWQFGFSMLSAVLLVIGSLWLYIVTFRQLRSCVRPPWWRSCVMLACLVAAWWLLRMPIEAARTHEALFAGYWNSQSPVWLRAHLGYSRIVAWQEFIYDSAGYLLVGLLLPMAMQLCACGWSRCVLKVYRHWFYWFCVLVCGFAASTLTWALADWAPAAGLAGQTFSVVARLGIAYTADILLWCFLLGLVAHYLDEGSDSL
jgi:hypothetical protein